MKSKSLITAGMLTTPELAKRLGIQPRLVRKMATGPRPKIKPIKLTDKYWLWHWPTVKRDLGFKDAA